MNQPKKHHYVPSSMLAGFTCGGTKRDRFYAVDLLRNKPRPSTPLNEGCRNGFYRVDAAGVDPMAIEKLTGRELEGPCSRVLAEIIRSNRLPTDDRGLGTLFSLLASLFSRVPKMREQAEVFWHQHLTNVEHQRVSGSYAIFQRAARAAGHDDSPAAYVEHLSDAKELDRAGGRWAVDRTTLVTAELQLAAEVTELFWDRWWTLLVSAGDDFICSDTPVVKIGGEDLRSPETSIYVALSRRHAVLGTLPGAGIGPNTVATREMVATFNAEAMQLSHELFWAPTPTFPILGPDGSTILNGATELLAAIAAQPKACEQDASS